jgi:hypothetical protein
MDNQWLINKNYIIHFKHLNMSKLAKNDHVAPKVNHYKVKTQLGGLFKLS